MADKIAWSAFGSSDSPMDMLVKLSRYYGQDEEFVIGGGGNTSVKDARSLWVKASGRSLADIDETGFAELDRAALAAPLEKPSDPDPLRREEDFKQAILGARRHPEKTGRPSVESVLHNLISARFVVHTHSTVVNMLTCCTRGEAIFQELFTDDAIWMPYVDPGITLAKALAAAIADYARRTGKPYPPAILVQNHGLIVSGETPDEIRHRTGAVLEKVGRKVAATPAKDVFGAEKSLPAEQAKALLGVVGPALRGLLAEGDALKIVPFDDSPVARSIACGASGQKTILGGPLTPDQIVYCNSYPLWVEFGGVTEAGQVVELLRAKLAEHVKATGFAPKMVLVAGLGLFAAGDDRVGAVTAGKVYLDAVKVMAGATRLGGIRHMPDRERKFIEGWEVEAYRKNIAAGKAKAGRAAGKVVLVTGAAQGFGLEIAKDFAAQAAHVVLADVNLAGAQAAAGEIAARAGAGRAAAVEVNVTSPASVEAAVEQIVRSFGGLDVLVSNAGVLRAESVKTQSERDFDFVTAVNYKGYFVCVQKVAPVLAAQHRARPSYRSDIIQINSKSGLAGSNRNFAYAGSKFGGVGLTQSFAMELIEDGVKVNAICPGNFFDGPLWSDPQNGLFVQYLRTGKVPGAKTVADVRKAYEAKVPMGRGCEAADVMRAIYYVIEQQYETGQAVPVTGGQVMLA